MSTALLSAGQRLRNARMTYDQRAGAAKRLGEEGLRIQGEVDRLAALVDVEAKATVLLTSLGEEVQKQAQDQLEQLVTQGLQTIFGTELSFHVVQSVRANQAVTDFVIRSSYTGSDGSVREVDTSVLDARGGGMAAVVGFMIRLVVMLLTEKSRRVLLLDETFAHLSREYEPRLAEFMAQIAERAGVQIVLVTHSDAYDDFADVRLRIGLGSDGASVVATVKGEQRDR